jgi:hypothetical protein
MTTEILKDYIIYKIYCKNKEITDEYYGHTRAFRARKSHHKNCCNNENDKEYNTDKYKIIRGNGGWNNWEMVHIEEIKSCSLINAKIREQYHIDLNKSKMNKFKAYITEEQRIEYHKEYYENNKEIILEKTKEYRLENRDTILEYNKEYYENNKEILLEKNKEYYENNKEIILEKKKEYYENNKDKVKEYYENNKEIILEKMDCACGKTYTKNNKSRHERSQFHCQFIETLSH